MMKVSRSELRGGFREIPLKSSPPLKPYFELRGFSGARPRVRASCHTSAGATSDATTRAGPRAGARSRQVTVEINAPTNNAHTVRVIIEGGCIRGRDYSYE